jgi:hypothetical protein
MSDRVRPFWCGSQSADWEDSNCWNGCAKNGPEAAQECEILEALTEAYFGDGTVSAEIAGKMGYREDRFVWPCLSRDPAWKGER